MKRLLGSRAGFTILETMIFLIISSVLIISALGLFSGRINRTEFSQTVQELDNTIKTTINEVASGQYANNAAFTCAPDATGIPILTPGGGEGTGTNTNCVYLGKVMQFGAAGPGTGCTSTTIPRCNRVYAYTMVGRRTLPGGSEVTSFASNSTGAYPRLAANLSTPCVNDGTTVDLTTCKTLKGGTYISNMKNKTTNTQIGAIAITQSLPSYSATGSVSTINSGAQTLISWPVATAYPRTPTQINTSVSTSSTFAAANRDPADGIVVCLQNGSSNKASITIGVNDGRIASKVFMGEDPACA